MTTPRTLRKLRKPASLLVTSTLSRALSPIRSVVVEKSVDIAGRDTPRTIRLQNFPYEPEYCGLSHCSSQTGEASLVKAADLPSPACQWAKSGSMFFPSSDATSGISMVGFTFLAESTRP